MRTFIEKCLVSALVAARRAGNEILEVYHTNIDVTYKKDDSPLTLADERAHQAILRSLPSLPPKDIPILSEEGRDIPYEERAEWEYLWVVDPLDGTKEFVKRRDEFTVNIALIEKSRPVIGVVFLPAAGSLYFAAEGFGSYKVEKVETVGRILDEVGSSSGKTLQLRVLLDGAVRLPASKTMERSSGQLNLVGSRSHGKEALADFVEKMKEQYGKVGFVPAGSALKFCLVAEGKADLYPRFGPTMEWDTAAGHCVVEQSGGAVLQMGAKTPLEYNKRDLHNPYFICLGKDLKETNISL